MVVPARDRVRLERTCRYALRPPVAHDRIQLTAEGRILLTLRHRWADGTTHLLFDPIELLERLASLIPRPRINLILYYGVLGAHAAWRSRLGAPETPGQAMVAESDTPPGRRGVASTSSTRSRSNFLWAQLMQRSFGFDVLACPRCGGRFRLVALIEDAAVIQRILRHLGLPIDVPTARPSRAPPLPFGAFRRQADADLTAP